MLKSRAGSCIVGSCRSCRCAWGGIALTATKLSGTPEGGESGFPLVPRGTSPQLTPALPKLREKGPPADVRERPLQSSSIRKTESDSGSGGRELREKRLHALGARECAGREEDHLAAFASNLCSNLLAAFVMLIIVHLISFLQGHNTAKSIKRGKGSCNRNKDCISLCCSRK